MTDPQPVRVLLIDDDQDYFVLTRSLLADIEGAAYQLDWAQTYTAGLDALTREPYAVCLLDYQLGERTGLELLAAARQAGCEVPFILLTGHGGHQVDMAAMRAGAADFVTKAGMNATGLERAIRYTLERARTLKALQERERRIAELYEREQSRSQELEQAYGDLRRAEARRDELVHMIAHDLRGPLTTIHINLDLISRAVANPSRGLSIPRLVDRTQKNTQRILGMIADMLKVSRLEAGALRPVLAPLNVPALLADRLPDYGMQAADSDQELAARVAEGLPEVDADADLIGRVLDNLVANAVKYTPAGGHIVIGVEKRAGGLVVSVCDDGPGIAPEHQARIFDKFFQIAEGETGSARPGIGLGLTFCRLAVEAHGGQIWVESTPPQGSVFFFSLPLTR